MADDLPDIVERLRWVQMEPRVDIICDDAATEIEALRSVVRDFISEDAVQFRIHTDSDFPDDQIDAVTRAFRATPNGRGVEQ